MVRVVFLHPDLGIGGAERLVVDAALALKSKSHEVQFLTAHHDPTHAFPETVDGQLSITCVGDWLPRTTFGYLAAFWAYIRMIYVAIYLVFFSNIKYDIVFVDIVSACIPFLKLNKKSKVVFYCHFPDQLLTKRQSLAKKLYRAVIDFVEEYTTKLADCVLVNSKFTSSVYKSTFKTIINDPIILYPSLNFSQFDKDLAFSLKDIGIEESIDVLFFSLNRYERKKNIGLSILALKHLVDTLSSSVTNGIHLVIAGGYDNRVNENIEHYKELVQLAIDNNVSHHVTFLKSPNSDVKLGLLKAATCLIYTPDNEHFGIVPIESMYCKTPVIAVSSGGPKETVVHGHTGFLCKPNAQDFSQAMQSFVVGTSSKALMGNNCQERVINNFSFYKFSSDLDNIITNLVQTT